MLSLRMISAFPVFTMAFLKGKLVFDTSYDLSFPRTITNEVRVSLLINDSGK